MIVLSLTILVMAILTATALITLEDSGLVGRSKNTVSKQNYNQEYERLNNIKNQILAKDFGIITVDKYITELQNKGIIESGVVNNDDGSKSVTTKLGLVANIIQDGESNLIISLGTSNAEITLNTNTLSGDITDGDVTKTINVTTKNVTGDITWTTTNSTVAIVNGNNSTATVTMKRPGTTKIVASYGAAKAICDVTVTGTIKEPTITLDKTTITKILVTGSTLSETLTASMINMTGTINWTTSNSSVAKVSGNGNTATVTILGGGTAVITAKSGTVKATCTINVTEKALSEIPVSANRPFTLGDYTCTVEWASSTAEYTIACDAIDKNNNPVYILEAGMTKAEYDALGLKYRKGSWIFIGYGTYVSKTATGYYSTGEILDTYAANLEANRCPMFQVNGNGTISVNSSNSSISTNNSIYTTENTTVYSITKYSDVFNGLSDSTVIYSASCIMMFDGSSASVQAASLTTAFDMTMTFWNQIEPLTFVPGSLIYCNYDMPGNLVLVDTIDGYNCYVVAE